MVRDQMMKHPLPWSVISSALIAIVVASASYGIMTTSASKDIAHLEQSNTKMQGVVARFKEANATGERRLWDAIGALRAAKEGDGKQLARMGGLLEGISRDVSRLLSAMENRRSQK